MHALMLACELLLACEMMSASPMGSFFFNKKNMFVLARQGEHCEWMLVCEIETACAVMGAIHTKDNRARV